MGRVAKKPQQEAFNRNPNCFGRFQEHDFSLVQWRDESRALMLEIGAGTAAISLNFARTHPDWQIIALDRKSDRLNKAARCQKLENLAFLHADLDNLKDYIDLKHQTDLIWLAFPDPFPKKHQSKHRLTHPDKLAIYKDLLIPRGLIRFKTDNAQLFAYSLDLFLNDPDLEVLKIVDNLKRSGYGEESEDVQVLTNYEKRFLEAGSSIHYLEVESGATSCHG